MKPEIISFRCNKNGVAQLGPLFRFAIGYVWFLFSKSQKI